MVDQDNSFALRLQLRDGAGGDLEERTCSGPVIQVGRGPGNDLAFADPRVSSLHGRLRFEAEQPVYQDLGSTNGSAVLRQGTRHPVGSHQEFVLQPGDEIQLGDAQRPTSIRVVEFHRGALPKVPDATVVAQRALGEVSAVPEVKIYHRLLQLLASLRTDRDTFTLAGEVLGFLIDNLPAASQADCYMQDTTGRFAPLLSKASGPEVASTAPPAGSLMRKMVETRASVLIEDVQEVPTPSRSVQNLPVRSVLLAPLVVDDQVVGAIQVGSDRGHVFREQDLDLVAVLAQQLSAVLSGTRLIERLQEAEARLRGECDYLKEKLGHRPALEEMVGRSPALDEVRRQIDAVAATRTTILIQGATGVGKELVARAIHEQGPRRAHTFAAVNCSALAAGVLESELFGHMKGAFTGAHCDRSGLFEVAHQGTLFLDEIGDLPLALQPKLLRACEEGTVLPVGTSRPRQVDVRVLAATHRDLEQEVAAGRFRRDLFYRLNVFTLQLPPLCARREDILPLAEHFLARFSTEHNRRHPGLTPEAVAVLEAYAWPGNIRELKNEMERASLLAPADGPVDQVHLSERLGGGGPRVDQVEGTLRQTMERLERMVVKSALERHGGNRTRCAKTLGISRQALIAKIARHDLAPEE